MMFDSVVFFFQAEGGIRDWSVTGVQTCALPIFPAIMESMRDFHRTGRGLLGICLGSQLMARASGGKVRRHTHLEVGFTDLTVTPEGQKDPVVGGLGPKPRIMQWHEDTFDLPGEAELLMAGDDCRTQAL